MAGKVKVGIIGCGNISGQYFRGCAAFGILDMVACADKLPERAKAQAKEFGIARACSVDELLADPEIRIVVNLTVPKAHAEVNAAALEAGRNVHCEKPLAVTREEGRRTVELAKSKKLLLGCAPDTFLGGGIQTCRKLIDDGWIGEPVAATAFMACPGHESWHPAPEFYYETGGGPMLDMGPYYLTALVNLLGGARRVAGSAKAAVPERIITSQGRFGERIPVETPTHITGVIDFESGVAATVLMSFDVQSHRLPIIEIYGTDGTLAVPDPNGFGGPVRLRRRGASDWEQIPLTHSPDVGRGIGVADMAYALEHGRPHRANGDVAFHVLDLMLAFEASSVSGRRVELESRCDRPAPLPMGLLPGTLDA